MTNWLLRTFIKNSDHPEDPKVRAAVGILSGIVGIFCNILLFGGKLAVGLLTRSVSITADAMNNLSDATSSVVTMLGFRLAERPADEEHPFGHARYEYLSGLAVSALILIIGVELAKSSLDKVLHPAAVEFGWTTAAVLAGSILVKLWMSLFNTKLGKPIPSATLAATAAGAALVGFSGKPPFIRAATVGKIEDMGITDLNNMGAAMAGAAYDTLTRHMKHRGTHPQDYDVIITGDLGQVGSDLLYDLFQRDGVSLREHHKDCGLMIYDRAAQDVHAGGSGCGCSASMMCGHFFKRIQAGELKRVLYCATGALMSPTVVQQGGSIPGIAHCVEISSEAGG